MLLPAGLQPRTPGSQHFAARDSCYSIREAHMLSISSRCVFYSSPTEISGRSLGVLDQTPVFSNPLKLNVPYSLLEGRCWKWVYTQLDGAWDRNFWGQYKQAWLATHFFWFWYQLHHFRNSPEFPIWKFSMKCTNNSKVFLQVGLVSGHHLTPSILKCHLYITATVGWAAGTINSSALVFWELFIVS